MRPDPNPNIALRAITRSPSFHMPKHSGHESIHQRPLPWAAPEVPRKSPSKLPRKISTRISHLSQSRPHSFIISHLRKPFNPKRSSMGRSTPMKMPWFGSTHPALSLRNPFIITKKICQHGRTEPPLYHRHPFPIMAYSPELDFMDPNPDWLFSTLKMHRGCLAARLHTRVTRAQGSGTLSFLLSILPQ